MLLPKGGVNWKSAKSRLPPWRALITFVSRPRVLTAVAVTGLIVLLWRGISVSTREMSRYGAPWHGHVLNTDADTSSYYCFGPSKPPTEMSINEMVSWNAHLQTPVLFNHHEPYEVNSSSITTVDLNPIKSTPRALANQERVLILTPLRDAAPYLAKYFDLLSELTYSHDLIDLAFLVGDSIDDTLAVLGSELDRIQSRTDKIPFRSATIVQKDFGKVVDMSVQEKHGFAAQGPRRKAIGRARNYLLYAALKPEHAWVYWRDVDIVDSPKKILEDFMAHDKDILVPSTSKVPDPTFFRLTILFRHLVPPLRKWSRCRRQM